MKYISTRGNFKKVEAAEAIRTGMVPSGGLFVPESIPGLTIEEISKFQDRTYQEIALEVLELFLTDYSIDELKESIEAAYNRDSFPVEEVAPLVKLNDSFYILELWHGPTAAFKDMALQLMPRLLQQAVKKLETDKKIVILVATSGDTGKAALEGFKDLEGIEIIVFYPAEGVSKIQEVQMTTTGGENTHVVAVEGNFDDCQTAVKSVFADEEFNKLFNENCYQFSSANSINWGRLVPQIVYYFSTYAYLLKNQAIEAGEKINISVPTGNFGNILAAYYAYRMGLPVNRFICASNDNKVLTDFLNTGIYDANRDFKRTISPSMDILISSNLERFLFEITEHDSDKINSWYQDLKESGKFQIDKDTLGIIQAIFTGDFSTEKEAERIITGVYKGYNYVIDPHTAVGIGVAVKYLKDNDDNTLTVVDSTANPYKFSEAVLESITNKADKENEYQNLIKLHEITGLEIHRALKNLDQKEVRHKRICNSDKIREEILDVLDI
ncbi:MAG: threonine synthase [Halanaerobiales bacterium]